MIFLITSVLVVEIRVCLSIGVARYCIAITDARNFMSHICELCICI